MDVIVLVPVPAPVPTSIPVPATYFCRRTELIEVSDTGIGVVPNLPKYPVPVILAIYTGGMPRYVPYGTHARKSVQGSDFKLV